MAWMQIFRAGTHVANDGNAYTLGAEMLQEVVASYNPAIHEAPLVVGHPRDNAPAFGWVQTMRTDGELLEAEGAQLDAGFVEAVRSGRFKKISASFYPPGSPSNPTPGQWYLRHVGFLGAQPPAVKGLRDASFADVSECVEFEDASGCVEFSEQLNGRDSVMNDQEKLAAALKEKQATEEREKALREKEQALAAREQALAAQEAKAVEAATAIRVAADASFVEGLVKEGRVLPRQQAGLTAMLGVTTLDQVVEFSEGSQVKKVKGTEFLRTFLKELPVQVEYSEIGGGMGNEPEAISFAAPPGFTVDQEQLRIHTRALEYQAKHQGTPYVVAIKAVGGR